MSEKPYLQTELLVTPELVAIKRQIHMLLSDYDLENVHYEQGPSNDSFVIRANKVEDMNFFKDLNLLVLDFENSVAITVDNTLSLVILVTNTLPIKKPTLH
ncbi:MAG: hypothetical protein RLZZ70_796 [Candidatus Parcubacteria bacterium]|jgi:hypothetical protein